MGIDVYLNWKDQTKEERDAQITGFSVVHGHTGYLREAYHGGPYATEVLVPEGWDESLQSEHTCDADDYKEGTCEACQGVIVPNALLRERLPAVIETVKTRGRLIYHQKLRNSSPEVKSFVNFVELHGRLEAEGREPRIYVSY